MARTILHERLRFPAEVIEHQLAHRVPDALGSAYNGPGLSMTGQK